jgi:bacterioferritin-associated ferredoxin
MHNHFQIMIVCICRRISDRDVDAMIDNGASTIDDIGRRCGAGTDCGTCVAELRDRIAERRDCGVDRVPLRARVA